MAEGVLMTGKRREGKTLSAIAMALRYLREGRKVATNVDLFLDAMLPATSRAQAWRLPDWPSLEHFEALPVGNENPRDEGRNGLLVLDEVGTWLNSRDWQQSDRRAVISWLLQSGKLGWDLVIIAQHTRLVDAQIRDSLCELHGVCRRLDKFRVPYVGGILQAALGRRVRLPKFHITTFFYGFGPGAPVADRMVFSGASVYKGYDTTQKISGLTGQEGLSCYLSPWLTKGRYIGRFKLLRAAWFSGLAAGLVAGVLVGGVGVRWFWPSAEPVALAVEQVEEKVNVVGVLEDGGRLTVALSDGRVEPVSRSKADGRGVRYEVGGKWYGQR